MLISFLKLSPYFHVLFVFPRVERSPSNALETKFTEEERRRELAISNSLLTLCPRE